jgi:hypothetical protein
LTGVDPEGADLRQGTRTARLRFRQPESRSGRRTGRAGAPGATGA